MAQLNTIQDDKPRTSTKDRNSLKDTRIDNFDDLIIQDEEPIAGRPSTSKPSGVNNSNNKGNEYRTPEIEKSDAKAKGGNSPKGGQSSAQLTQKSKDYISSIQTPQETKSFLEKARSILGGDKHTPKYFVDALPIIVNDPYNINTPERLANFMGQCMAESGLFPKTEAMNYSAKRLLEVFPKNVTSIQQAREMVAKGPSKIGGWADRIYGKKFGQVVGKISPARDGNQGTPEGYTYRGHGLIQTTGKSKFIAFDKKFAGYDESGNVPKIKSLTGYDDFRPIVKGSDPKNDPPGAKPRTVEEGHFTIFPDITANPKDPIWAVITSLEYFRINKELLVNNVSPSTSKRLTEIVRGISGGYQLRHKWASYFYNILK